jgi:hypothetical protein
MQSVDNTDDPAEEDDGAAAVESVNGLEPENILGLFGVEKLLSLLCKSFGGLVVLCNITAVGVNDFGDVGTSTDMPKAPAKILCMGIVLTPFEEAMFHAFCRF